MEYEVILSETAEAEADEIFLYLLRVAPNFANRWYEGFLESVRSLDTFPRRCPVAPENENFPDAEVRVLLYRTGRTVYRILYTILDDNLVRVMSVRHGARNRNVGDATDDE